LLAPELTRRGAPARPLVGELTWVAAHAADHLADAGEIPQDAASEAVRCAGELARACNPAYGLLTGGGRCWNGVHHCGWDLNEKEELGKEKENKSLVIGDRDRDALIILGSSTSEHSQKSS
jgi:hypothetical protein